MQVNVLQGAGRSSLPDLDQRGRLLSRYNEDLGLLVRLSLAIVQTGRMVEFVLRAVHFRSPLVQCLLDEWNNELGFAPRGGAAVQAADFEAPHGVFLVACAGNRPLGCGGLRRLAPDIGEVKRLFVGEEARGKGVGQALLAELERRAAGLGFEKLRLDTDAGATAALALFRSAGYQHIRDYNGNPYASYWLEKPLGRQPRATRRYATE